MAVISGIGGGVTYASGYVANVRSWNISLTADSLETTKLDATNSWRTRIQGLKSWSGSYSCYVDGTAVATLDDGVGNAPASALFRFNESGGSAKRLEGTIIVTDMSITNTTDSATEVEYTFEGSGELSIATS
tara:strand:- start:17162 stop:17557 length:396 start_codon:yes stop_codon:yes gene_type:complete